MGSDRETLSAATGSVGVGIVEHKPLAVEAAGELQFCANEVEEALSVDHDGYAVVFKTLVSFLLLVVEGQLIHQSAASSTFDTNANEAPIRGIRFGHQAANLVAGILVNSDHAFGSKKPPFRGMDGKGNATICTESK